MKRNLAILALVLLGAILPTVLTAQEKPDKPERLEDLDLVKFEVNVYALESTSRVAINFSTSDALGSSSTFWLSEADALALSREIAEKVEERR